MTLGNAKFQSVEGSGWSRGLGNHLRGELGRWFRSRKWWGQVLIFAVAINLFLILIMSDPPNKVDPVKEIVSWFNGLLGIVGAFGVIILMQGALVGEKKSGTAAWVLSKPISRPAFLLSKLIGNTIGIVVTIILAQALIGYLAIYVGLGTALSPPAFLAALVPHVVNLFFYIALTLMLGVIFNHWGPVVAIPIAFLMVDEFVVALAPPALLDVLMNTLPYGLATGYGDATPAAAPSIATSLMLGTQPYSLSPIFWTLLFSGLFVAVGIWLFRRQEF